MPYCTFCYKTKNKEHLHAKIAKNDNDYTFVMCNGIHFKSVYKWIIDLGAIKYVISHRTAFNTSKIIDPCNVYLEDDCVVKAIGMGSIIVEAIVKGKINCVVIKDVLHMPELQTNVLPVC